MLKNSLKRTADAFKALMARVKGLGIRRLGGYAALALMLTALGVASANWRNRGTQRMTGTVSSEPELPMAAMAGATTAPDGLSTWLDELTELPTPAPTPDRPEFVWPVSGEVIGAYAPDSLIWSATLGQWQTHPAIDISAAVGESVCACADGVVEDAWEDPLWGKVIKITHAEGYASTYANLSTLQLVSPGESVTAGQTISAVGTSAACEAEMPGHLHFFLEKDGESVDFDKTAS